MGRTVRQIRRKEKSGPAVSDGPEGVTVPTGGEGEAVSSEVALIQALIPVALARVQERLLEELTELAGPRYARRDEAPHRVRWGHQAGSVYLGDQKVPLEVPRVRDRVTNSEVGLPTYRALQQPREADRTLLRAILGGLSTREYGACVRLVPDAFGLSASSVSRRFRRASHRYLQALQERPLGGYGFVAVVLDGKAFAEDEMVLAVGVTVTGEKVILGVVQTATENRPVCSAFLRSLLARGLHVDEGILVVVDGAKGLAAAVREVFGSRGVLQRCQWHKRENVVRYLPKAHQVAFRRKLQAAYEQPTYERAKRALRQVRRELLLVNSSAVASLDEGLEETLTLHRLGAFGALGVSLKTTNVLESIHARVASRTDKVDHWKNSAQKHRWVVTALLELEPRLNRIKGHRALPRLQLALKRALRGAIQTAVA
jgi:putative transposase